MAITSGMTGVPCVCGFTHRFTPSAMAVLLLIGETGELHYVVGQGEIRYHCLFTAITNLPDDDPRFSLYRGSIRFDKGSPTRHPSIVHTRPNGHGNSRTDRNGTAEIAPTP